MKELIISDARLGSPLNVLFGALAETTIEQLDICNNEIGNYGARLLSKALQMNTSIRVLALDRNQIGPDGFSELAHALRVNYTLISIPYPTLDIADSLTRLDRSKLLVAVGEIERSLSRNRNHPVDRCRNRCGQRLMQDLNSKSVLYEVDSSSQKKIIFHYLMKVLSEMEEKTSLSVSTDGIVENFLSNVLVLAKDNDQHFFTQLQTKLAEHNVDICEISNKSESNREMENIVRAKVRQLIEQFLM